MPEAKSANLSQSTRTESKRFNGLQVLRICACTAVMMFHVTATIASKGPSPFPVLGKGIAGVDVFFVLSGFIMLYSAERLAGERYGWRTFVVHRLARIVPLYWLVTLLFLAGGISTSVAVVHRSYFPGWVAGSFLFLPFRGPGGSLYPVCTVGWTLVYEVFFYMVVALALWFQVSALRYCAVVLGLLSAVSLIKRNTWPAASFYCDPILLEFLFGMAIYRLHQRGIRLPRWCAALLAVLGCGLIMVPPFGADLARTVTFGMPATMIVAGMVGLESWFARTPRPLLYLAEASYALYLVHTGVIEVFARMLARYGVRAAPFTVTLSMVGSVAVASILRSFVELPLYRKLIAWCSGWLATPQAQSLKRRRA